MENCEHCNRKISRDEWENNRGLCGGCLESENV